MSVSLEISNFQFGRMSPVSSNASTIGKNTTADAATHRPTRSTQNP